MPFAHSSVVQTGFDDKGHATWGPSPEDAPEAEVKAKVVDAPKKGAPKKTEGAETA